MEIDLKLRDGLVFNSATRTFSKGDLLYAGGKLYAGPEKNLTISKTVDLSGKLIVPGLIDLHTHVYHGATSLGVDPDSLFLESATTTLVDAGSAGAGNFLGLRNGVMERSEARILAFLNISYAGIFGFGGSFSVGEGSIETLLDTAQCLLVASENRDHIVGIKARVGPSSSGASGILPLTRAADVARALDLPVMVHVEGPPPTVADIVDALDAGDILTHCCRPLPNSMWTHDSTVDARCVEARRRGVIFDIGHGRGSFSFDVFRHLRDSGFLPDVVSSDVHAFNRQTPAVHLLETMSKLLALDIPLETVIAMATMAPAAAIRRPALGLLSEGDASVLEIVAETKELRDSVGEVILTDRQLKSRGVVRSGKWIPAGP